MQNEIKEDFFKSTKVTWNGEKEDNGKGDNGKGEWHISCQIGPKVSFEYFIKVFGFDLSVLDNKFHDVNVTSNEVASIPTPELIEEFKGTAITMVK
ncbi:hypothetical protein DPMN_123844 [Dreissena polymorpha]|uniref:Uncharacterized protein n=1 Tax=Dreissena polymorpha TaxID=45954 RepID=A0A9D4GV92_DREPO|nr:hypothetical protein DPMN_123844 [Dreissena polymorpha]